MVGNSLFFLFFSFLFFHFLNGQDCMKRNYFLKGDDSTLGQASLVMITTEYIM